MSTRAEEFAGLCVAMTTPFRGGKVNVEAFRRDVEFQIEAGTTCICPVGTTGESPTLTYPEHEQVIAVAVEAAAGRIKVMPGTGSNSTAEALELTRWAAAAGADAALVVAPYYNKPTQEGLFEHFGVGPCGRDSHLHLQYSRPDGAEHRAGNHCTAGRAAQYHHDQGSHWVAGPGFADRGHHRPLGPQRRRQSHAADPGRRRPGRGFRGRKHRAAGRDRPDSRLRAGRRARAQCWHRKLFPLCRDMLGLSTNPIPIKAALKILGRDTGELRMPLTPLGPEQESRLRQTLAAYGLSYEL